MIDLLPIPHDRFACPCGAAELIVEGFMLAGMFPFAPTLCPRCNRRFLSRLHSDFCSDSEFHCDTASGEVFSNAPDWYRGQLMDALRTRDRTPPPMERLCRRPLGPDVAVLNALDPVYGHCLHKLFSYSAIKDTAGVSTLAIVPSFLKWLAPDSIDEVWVIDEPRQHMTRWNQTVADAFGLLAATSTRLRYVDLAWGHRVNIEDYTGVTPRAAGIAPARIVLNWREDRCWTLRGRPLAREAAVAEQLRLFTLLLETLRGQMPDLQAYVTGYGQSGDFPQWVHDLRIVKHDSAAEQLWAKVTAKSHLAFGIHGSNMILPAAHAAAALEIVPAPKWSTILVTWEFVNAGSATDALARYRQLAASTSVSDIASVAFAQIRRAQMVSLGSAARATSSPQEAIELRIAHHDVGTPFAPLVCRDDDGTPI